ncbi:MAG: C25 family cysteine peptidase, partial [Candidatus Zixiibacteriota bacterium]
GYRVANAVLGAVYRGTPLYSVSSTMGADSIITERVIARTEAELPAMSAGVAGILSQNIVQTSAGAVLRLEVPLVIWDAASGIARWIDQFDLVADPGMQLRKSVSAVTDVPPFGSQRFIQRSMSLDTAGAWINYSDQSIRFHVTQDGMYKLTRDWFLASGFPLSGVDPSTLALYRKGTEIPLLAVGLEDGTFDAADYVAFEGNRNYNEGGYRSVPGAGERDDPYPDIMNMYSDSTAYWVVRKANAARVAPAVLTDTPGDTVDWAYRLWQLDYDAAFASLAVSSERINNSDWTSEDVWYLDPYTAGRRRIYQFPVSGVRTDLPARLWVKVAGWTSFAPTSPQFRFTVAMNSPTSIDSVEFDVSQQALFATALPAGVLHNGNDSLIVTNVAMDPPAVRDGILDWYDVEYPSTLQANRDKLAFTLDTLNGFGLRTFKIEGVTAKTITVLKISAYGTSALTALRYAGDGPYTLLFADTAAPGTKYLLSSTLEMLQPMPGTTLAVENLRDASKQAAYVIVTTKAFAAVAEEYRQFIASSYGLAARVVNVEDIYDNYSYGIF